MKKVVVVLALLLVFGMVAASVSAASDLIGGADDTPKKTEATTTAPVTTAPTPETPAEPSGTVEITENGTFDISKYASASVNVPQTIVNGITPSGTLDITSNGTYDASQYASVSVNVPQSGGGFDTSLLSGSDGIEFWERDNSVFDSGYALAIGEPEYDDNGEIVTYDIDISVSHGHSTSVQGKVLSASTSVQGGAVYFIQCEMSGTDKYDGCRHHSNRL